MWVINLVYLINPIKVLNYHSRMYFLMLVAKNLISPLRPMNLNIFLMAMILASYVQPFNDLVFTICTLRTYDQAECQEQARTATFIYVVVYCFYRICQNIRFQIQMGEGKIYSRPNAGTLAVIVGTHAAFASYLYGSNPSSQLLTYWIVSAAISTITGIHADFKADWGMLSFDGEDCFLRKNLHYKRSTFYFWCVVDAILNVTWVLTVSNALNAFLNINVLYFFMIVQFLELCRRGIWMNFRLEDDHSANVSTLQAIADDSHFTEQV